MFASGVWGPPRELPPASPRLPAAAAGGSSALPHLRGCCTRPQARRRASSRLGQSSSATSGPAIVAYGVRMRNRHRKRIRRPNRESCVIIRVTGGVELKGQSAQHDRLSSGRQGMECSGRACVGAPAQEQGAHEPEWPGDLHLVATCSIPRLQAEFRCRADSSEAQELEAGDAAEVFDLQLEGGAGSSSKSPPAARARLNLQNYRVLQSLETGGFGKCTLLEFIGESSAVPGSTGDLRGSYASCPSMLSLAAEGTDCDNLPPNVFCMKTARPAISKIFSHAHSVQPLLGTSIWAQRRWACVRSGA